MATFPEADAVSSGKAKDSKQQGSPMPYRLRRRELFITVNPWMLVGSIAVGLWLGFMAILITCALIYKVYEEQQIRQVNSALRQMGEAFQTPPARPQVDASAQMFEQFKQNQAQLQREQAEAQAQAAKEQRITSPQCRFWMQQHTTAPTEKSQENVSRYCY